LNYEHEHLIIESCKEIIILIIIIIIIIITLVKNKINKVIRALLAIIVLFKSSVIVFVQLRDNTQLSLNRDFMFVSY